MKYILEYKGYQATVYPFGNKAAWLYSVCYPDGSGAKGDWMRTCIRAKRMGREELGYLIFHGARNEAGRAEFKKSKWKIIYETH